MNNHTPGPWRVIAPRDAYAGIDAETCSIILLGYKDEKDLRGIRGMSDVEAVANARLIAAAPDMLEALQSVAAWNEHEDACDECLSGPCSVGRPLRQKASHLTAMAIANATGKETL